MRITPPEDIEKEINNPVKPPADSYSKAHNFITRFNSWRSGKLTLSDSHLYEENFAIQVSAKDWTRLSSDLKLFEHDDKSISPLKNSLFLFY